MKLRFYLLWASICEQPIKWLVALLAIAVGVGLGYTVQLIQHKALSQFEAGIRTLSGQADLQLQPNSETLPLNALDALDALDEVKTASPILQMQVQVKGLKNPVDFIGLDPFRAGQVTPNLIGTLNSPDKSNKQDNANANAAALLASDTVRISPALQAQLSKQSSKAEAFDSLTSQVGNQTLRWKIVGNVPAAGQGQILAVADIAALQWRFNRPNTLSRIDIKLKEGVSVQSFITRHQAQFDRWGRFETLTQQTTRGASISQAYRANLSILAMVALLTGGFLSFSTQMLSVAQRARQWALLSAIGMSHRALQTQVFFEALLIGLTGALLGLIGGFALAQIVLAHLGADLGAGYFSQQATSLEFHFLPALLFLGFGVFTTTLGALLPAAQARNISLNQRLKSGSEEAGLRFANRAQYVGLAFYLLAIPCLFLPPWQNVPIGAYVAVALGLFGSIALIAPAVRLLIPTPSVISHLNSLALHRLASTPNLLALGLAGVVASLALVVSMHVMIYSFRHSLDDWLNQVLPAPLYLGVKEQNTPVLPKQFVHALESVQGIGKLELLSLQPLHLDSTHPAVKLIVRPLSPANVESRLPILGTPLREKKHPEAVAGWASEPMADIYHVKVGDVLPVKLDNGQQVSVEIMGIWRDYARQHGALAVSAQSLQRLGIKLPPSQAAIWPDAQSTVDQIQRRLETLIASQNLQNSVQFSRPDGIRKLSLQIFDRSFAVTYLLEVAALIIGLFGVATTFSAQGLQRKREFALLQALGATRGQLLKILLFEGFWSSLIATAIGLLTGLGFAWILIFIVNPQSFHWTMQWHTPWQDLAVLGSGLVAVACITLALAVQQALGKNPIAHLKEDWA